MDVANVTVVTEAAEVEQRLSELGVDVATLHEAIAAGLAERNACTANDPPGAAGFIAWSKTVRRLREQLIVRGWKRTNSKRLAAVVNPEGTVAIGVSSGDERTGLDGASPQTKYAKGPAWAAVVVENKEQLGFEFPETPEPELDRDEEDRLNRVTWVLMFHVAASETRCELSMPRDIGPDSKLDSWVERIVLPPISHDPEPVIEATEPTLEIDVPVRRRAG